METVNQGIAGDTLDALVSRIPLAYENGARLAVMTIGTNDIVLDKIDLGPFLARWSGLIADMRAHGLAIIATSINEPCAKDACRYVDLNVVIAPDGMIRGDLTLDGLHFNVAGYQVEAAQLAPLLRP